MIELRAPRPGDVRALARLSGELGYPATREQTARRLARLSADAESLVLVADDPRKGVVGWIHVLACHRLESGPFAEIGGLVVAEGRRGRGIGRALVRAGERWAAARGLLDIRVRSNVVREQTHRFYERQGYAKRKTQAVFGRTLAPVRVRHRPVEILLMTGFVPAGGKRENPSWEVARRLDGKSVGDFRVRAIRLPVRYGQCVRVAMGAVARRRPAAILMTGQAGGRKGVSVETRFVNAQEGLDAAGQPPPGRQVVPGGPEFVRATLPVPRIVSALRRAGIAARASRHAGRFLCNHLGYSVLYALNQSARNIPAGFIHLPFLPAQTALRRPRPASLSLRDQVRAVRIAATEVARGCTAGALDPRRRQA